MARRFENSWLVLDVARQQLDAFEREVRTYIGEQTDWLSLKAEGDGWQVARYHRLGDPPAQWTITAGQIAQGFREALDYLVYALSEEGGGNPSDPKAKTQWPIFTDRGAYPKWLDRMLRGVADPERAVIEWLQPFDDPSDRLAVLDRLTNDKKHRSPPATFVLSEPAEFGVYPADDRPIGRTDVLLTALPGVSLEPETEIGRVRLPDEPARKVNMDVRVNVTVVFGADRVAPHALREIGTDVAVIVERFERFRP